MLLMHEDLKNRLASEYRYAATRMQQATEPAKKLFYFSVFYGETLRVLNWEWNSDLVLIHMVTQQVYNQINGIAQNPASHALPIEWTTIYEKLTESASDLATYSEKAENDGRELCQVLGRLAEIAYATTGNGSYLYEKGVLKL